jgi:tetratricopeptide (TPR) repeat protein
LAPVVNLIFPSGIVLAERTLYLPSVGLAIAAGWVWDVLAPEGSVLRGPSVAAVPAEPVGRVWDPERRWLPIAATCVLVALVIRTWTRTPVWRSNKTVIVASLLGEPTAYRAHERAADVLERAGDEEGALREYARARALYREDPYLYEAAASIMAGHGDSGTKAVDELLDSARLVDPSPYEDMMRHARVRYAARDFRGTINLARAAYQLERDSVDAIMVLTQAAQRIDDVGDAATAFHLALADHPRDPALHQSYAAMLAFTGDSTGAKRELAKARLVGR